MNKEIFKVGNLISISMPSEYARLKKKCDGYGTIMLANEHGFIIRMLTGNSKGKSSMFSFNEFVYYPEGTFTEVSDD